MTILINDVSPIVRYTVGGTPTSAFAVPFEFFDQNDLMAFDGATMMTLGTDYTVTGAGVTGGGTLTTTVSKTNTTITIQRSTPVKRLTNYPLVGAFDIAALNTELARLTAMIADREEEFSRTFRVAPTDGVSTVIPDAATRASKYLGFDANGLPVALAAPVGTSVLSAFGLSLVDDASAKAAQATLKTALHQRDVVSATSITLDATNDLGRLKVLTAGSAITVNTNVGASTFGNGWHCRLKVADLVPMTAAPIAATFDPNAAETVNGRTSLSWRSGETIELMCDGSNWHAFPMPGFSQTVDGTNTIAFSSLLQSVLPLTGFRNSGTTVADNGKVVLLAHASVPASSFWLVSLRSDAGDTIRALATVHKRTTTYQVDHLVNPATCEIGADSTDGIWIQNTNGGSISNLIGNAVRLI